MKLFRTAALTVLLFAASLATAQDKPAGYDVGACSPDMFIAAHFEVSATAVTITEVSRGPGHVKVLEKPVIYKFVKKDAKGSHYLVKDTEELVIEEVSEKGLIGSIEQEGKPVAALFGIAGDGSKLAENAMKEFDACQTVLQEPASSDISKS